MANLKRKSRIKAGLSLAIIFPSSAFSIAAHARTTAVSAAAVEELTVTKDTTDIPPAFRTSTPRHSTTRVTVISGAELLKTGQTNIINALQQASPEINAPPGGGGGGYSTTPTQTVILRNLNADETLVLVNGVRRHSSALGNWNYGPAQDSYIKII